MRGIVAALMFLAGVEVANAYSTRDLADELLASRVCGLSFDSSAFTVAIVAIMKDTGLPRETVTAQARQLADDIQERLDTVNGPTQAAMCQKLRSRRPVFE